jgi:hypothetical protein
LRERVETTAAKKADSVFKVVDNILKQIFGEKGTLLIYRYLETHHSLQKHELTTKIDVFAKGLESFLSSGAPLIERKILDEIYSSYGIFRRMETAEAKEGYDFASQVRFAVASHKA